MKIALCFISNRPEKMLRAVFGIHNAIVPKHKYVLALSYESPFQKTDIQAISLGVPQWMEFRPSRRMTKKTPLFNYAKARLHSYSLADDCDYLIHVDDDFKFNDGQSTNHHKYSAGERYMDCIKYLEKDKSCGLVYTKGFLGGSQSGRSVIPMFGGFFETGTGVVLRGLNRRYKELIHPKFQLPGAGEDIALGMTSMFHGYYVAKALNTTVTRDRTKKLAIKNGDRKNTDNPNYNLAMVNSKGILAEVQKVFGPFKFGSGLPRAFIQEFDRRAKERM